MFVNNQHFQAGFIAAQQGEPETACPLLFEGQPSLMWKLGYSYALAEKLEGELNAEPLTRINVTPFQQGQSARHAGLKLNDNPFGNGDPHGTDDEKATAQAHIDWQQGWKAADGGLTGRPGVDAKIPPAAPQYEAGSWQANKQVLEQEPLTGGNVNYYLVHVPHPKRGGPGYTFEVEDVIEFAGMTFDEGCEFKAIVRTAMARKGKKKPGQDAVYDAEKRIHYATRSLATERRNASRDLDEIAPIRPMWALTQDAGL